MKTDPKKPFLDDLEKITNKKVRSEINQAVLAVQEAQTVRNIPQLRKLKGYKAGIYYRIRVRRYRIGITIVGDLVTLAKCLPKKDFYKHFP